MIITVDPGVNSCAYCIMNSETGEVEFVGLVYNSYKGVDKNEKSLCMVMDLCEEIQPFIDEYGIRFIICEWLTAGRSLMVGSVATMSAVVGGLAELARGLGCRLMTINPTVWKRGHRDKEQAWKRYPKLWEPEVQEAVQSVVNEIHPPPYKFKKTQKAADKAISDLHDCICIGLYVTGGKDG